MQEPSLVFTKLLYFAFTSLTTVGFGDFHPRSDTERVFIAFGLLLGVAVFSIVIGNILLMIDSYKKFHEIYEDSEALQRFFGVLKKFNWDEPIQTELQNNLINYFNYRWSHYKHHCFTDDYGTFVEQLPSETID